MTDPFRAADYDRSFTSTPLGSVLRRAAHRRLDARFSAGDRVLELGCGTGEDAVHLARRGNRVHATDASAEMVEQARAKIAAACLGPLASVEMLAVEDLPAADLRGPFDGAFSNFGALNCAADLGAVAKALADRLRPGAPLVLCVMGPWVPWEWGTYLLRGQPGRAFRRLRPGGVSWRGVTVRYPSIGRLRRLFEANFQLERVAALGALLPPSYLEAWTRRHPRLLAALDRWERRLERFPPFPQLADHYVAELVRR